MGCVSFDKSTDQSVCETRWSWRSVFRILRAVPRDAGDTVRGGAGHLHGEGEVSAARRGLLSESTPAHRSGPRILHQMKLSGQKNFRNRFC